MSIKTLIKLPIKLWDTAYTTIFFSIYKVTYGKNLDIRGKIFIRNHGKITIGDNFTCNCKMSSNPVGGPYQTAFAVKSGAELTIGNHVGISGTAIMCNRKISIGDHVHIGSGCCIYDTDFHSTDYILRRDMKTDIPKEAPVDIGNDVFIGARSMILKGVHIGNGAVVGAGSVVTKDIPAFEIWAGNPAVFVRSVKNEPKKV